MVSPLRPGAAGAAGDVHRDVVGGVDVLAPGADGPSAGRGALGRAQGDADEGVVDGQDHVRAQGCLAVDPAEVVEAVPAQARTGRRGG